MISKAHVVYDLGPRWLFAVEHSMIKSMIKPVNILLDSLASCDLVNYP